jgi:C4-dicarboxylate-specific signal transduction histidine kinase
MHEDEGHVVTHAFLALFSMLLALWLLSSWLVADSILKSRTSKLIQNETTALQDLANNTANAIDLSLDYLHGIPALIAREEKVSAALPHWNTSPATSIPAEQRKAIWSQDTQLKNIDDYLVQVSNLLGADVVWVTNAAGDCVASSNSTKPESFVGTNYADRDYFKSALEGKYGQQYAMGRKTNIPGLYFSAPIMIKGNFAGVAVAKIDLPKLSHWVNQADAFISDKHGVIILAHDSALDMHSLANADILQLSEARRLARYKRTDFPALTMTPWADSIFPSLYHLAQQKHPVLIFDKLITDESIKIHLFKPIPAASDFSQERIKLFFLIGTSGTLILLIIAGNLIFVRIRKRSELRAAQSASMLRAAIESTVDGILVVDSNRRVNVYNQRFADICHIPPELLARGQDEEEMMNFVFHQLEDPQAFVGRVKELDQFPEQSSFDTLHFKDGTDIERYSFPQRLGEQIVGRVWSFRDITERLRAEQALLHSRDELEQKVLERTVDLQTANALLQAEKTSQAELIKQLATAHSQLLQSEKMASIGQLAAGVAHEINNPVAYVNSNLTILQTYVADLLKMLSTYEQDEGELTTATQEKLAQMKQKIEVDFIRNDIGKLMSESIQGLQQVRRIVLDLKDFSHVGESEKRWTNIERGLDSTLNVVWNELKYKAEVIKAYGNIPEIECIPSQINQVFMNLLMNAVQAIEEHGVITIRTGQEGENIWLEVEDTGKGIEPQNMNRIFDPFFTTKPVGKGTGLGLSVSYNIVQKHGGKIELRSEQGKGTAFKVTLPRQGLK